MSYMQTTESLAEVLQVQCCKSKQQSHNWWKPRKTVYQLLPDQAVNTTEETTTSECGIQLMCRLKEMKDVFVTLHVNSIPAEMKVDTGAKVYCLVNEDT